MRMINLINKDYLFIVKNLKILILKLIGKSKNVELSLEEDFGKRDTKVTKLK
jgi:hypothetical protein